MKLRLGRRETVEKLPFTGYTFCGCRWLNGDVLEPCCREHAPRRTA